MNINESKAADQQQRNIPPSDNPQFQLEFWTNFLARNQPTAVNTPQNVAISAAAALFQPQVGERDVFRYFLIYPGPVFF
jgi:hypothetical protein